MVRVVSEINAQIALIPETISAEVVPLLKTKATELVEYIEDLLDEKFECKAISQDLYGIRNSLCTVATQGLDARWVASIVMALTFLLSIPIWICVANSFSDLEELRREEEEEEERKQSKKSSGSRGPRIQSSAPM